MRPIVRSVSKVTSSSSRANPGQTWQWVESALSSALGEVFTPMISYFNYWFSNTLTYEEQFIAKLQRYRNVVIDTQDGYVTLELKISATGKEVLGIVNEYGKVTLFSAPWEQQLSRYLNRIKANIQYVEYGDLSDTWDEDDFTDFKAELVSQGLISEDVASEVLDFNDAEISKHVRFGGEDRSLKLDLYLKWVNRYGMPNDELEREATHPIRNLAISGLLVSTAMAGIGQTVSKLFDNVSYSGTASSMGFMLVATGTVLTRNSLLFGLGLMGSFKGAEAAPVVANPIPDQVAVVNQTYCFTVPENTFNSINKLNYTVSLANGTAVPTWLNVKNGISPFVLWTGLLSVAGAPSLSLRDVYVLGNYAYLISCNTMAVPDPASYFIIVDISDVTSPKKISNYFMNGWPLELQIKGHYAYVSSVGNGLTILDIQDPINPISIGNIGFYSGVEARLSLSGNYAYVAQYQGVTIVDVTNPNSPQIVGNYGTANYAVNGLFALGDYLYIANIDNNGLQIVDIKNPANPTLISTCIMLSPPGIVYVNNNYAYVLTDCPGGTYHNTAGSMTIVDISDISNPVIVTTYYPLAEINDIFLLDNYVYISTSSGIEITDISNPSHPTRLATFNVPAGNLYALNDYLYFATFTMNQMYVLSGIKSTPTLYGIPSTFEEDHIKITASDNTGSASDIFELDVLGITCPLLYVYTEDSPILLSNIYLNFPDTSNVNASIILSDPAAGNITIGTSGNTTSTYNQGLWQATGCAKDVNNLLSSIFFSPNIYYNKFITIKISAQNMGNVVLQKIIDLFPIFVNHVPVFNAPIPDQILLGGTYSFMPSANTFLDGDGDVLSYIFQRSNSTELPVWLYGDGIYNTTLLGEYGTVYAKKIEFSANKKIAYIADSGGGGKILNVNDINHITSFSTYPAIASIQCLKLFGNILYIGDGSNGLKILDVSNPSNPLLLGALNAVGNIQDILTQGNLLYLAALNEGLQIINVFDPTSPQVKGSYPTLGYAYAVKIIGNEAYLAVKDKGLQILNVSNAVNVMPLGAYVPVNSDARGVAVNGNTVYLADGTNGMQIVDVTNPASCKLLSTFVTAGPARKITFYDNKAYISEQSNGIEIVDVTNSSQPILLQHYITGGETWDVKIMGGLAYVADGPKGLRILDGIGYRHSIGGTPTAQDPSEILKVIATDGYGRAESNPFRVSFEGICAPQSYYYIGNVNNNLNFYVQLLNLNEQATVKVTLSDTDAGQLLPGTSGTVTSTYNPITGIWQAQGYLPDINSLLQNLTFQTKVGYNNDFQVTVEFDDGVHGQTISYVAMKTANIDVTVASGSLLNFAVPSYFFQGLDPATMVATAMLSNGNPLPSWMNFNVYTKTLTGTPGGLDRGEYLVKVQASDGPGNHIEKVFIVSVPNTKPYLNRALSNVHLFANQPLNFIIPGDTFLDINADSIVYSVNQTMLAPWISFSNTTRALTGIPAVSDRGTSTAKIIANDGHGGTAATTFEIGVENTSPVGQNTIPNFIVKFNIVWQYTIPANIFYDSDGDLLTYTATLADGTQLPSFILFNSNLGTFYGNPIQGDQGQYNLKVTADDGYGGKGSTIFTINVPRISDQHIYVQQPFNFVIPSDTFGLANYQFSVGLVNGDVLPTWLSYMAESHRLLGVPNTMDKGTLNMGVTGYTAGQTKNTSFLLSVTQAPVVNSIIPNQVVQINKLYNYSIPLTIFQSDNPLIYNVILDNGGTFPSWLTFDVVSKTLGGTPGILDRGTLKIRIIGDDSYGTTVSETYSLKVNTAPTQVEDIITQQVAQISQPYYYAISSTTFVDLDGDILSYKAGLSNGNELPTWMSFDSSTRKFSGIPGDSDKNTLQLLLNVTDGYNGNAATAFTLYVKHFPALSKSLVSSVANIGQEFIYGLGNTTFSNVDGNPLTYTAVRGSGQALPAWLTFNTATLQFSGIPTVTDAGTYTISVTASDGQGGAAAGSFPLIVEHFPIVSGTAPSKVPAGIDISLSQSFFGFFSDLDGDALTFTATKQDGQSLLSWLNFDRVNCILSGTPQAPIGTFPVRIRATDPSGGAADLLFELNIRNYPTLSGTLSSQVANIGSLFTYTIPDGIFTDKDGNTLTYTVSRANQSPLPTWLTFASSNNTLIGTPQSSDKGSMQIFVTANDGQGGTTIGTFPLIVEQFPTIKSNISELAAAVGHPFTFTVFNYFSSAESNVLYFSAALKNGQDFPSWFRFNKLTCTFSGVPSQNDIDDLVIKLTANDLYGGYVDTTVTIRVDYYAKLAAAALIDPTIVSDAAPVVANPVQIQLATVGMPYSISIDTGIFQDDDDENDQLTYSADLQDAAEWLEFDNVTNVIKGIPRNIDAYTYRTRAYHIIISAASPSGKAVRSTFELDLNGNSLTATVLNYLFAALGAVGTVYGYIQQKHLIWNILMKQNYVCKPEVELTLGSSASEEQMLLHKFQLPANTIQVLANLLSPAITKIKEVIPLKRGYYRFLNGLAHLMYTRITDEKYLRSIKSIVISTSKAKSGYCMKKIFALPILGDLASEGKTREFPYGTDMYLLDWLFYNVESNQLMIVSGGPKPEDADSIITIQVVITDGRILEEFSLKVVESVDTELAEAASSSGVALTAIESTKPVEKHGRKAEKFKLMKPAAGGSEVNTPPMVSPATLGDPQKLQDDIANIYGKQAASNLGLFFAQRPYKSDVGCEVAGLFADEVQKNGLQLQIKRLGIATALLEETTLYVSSGLIKTLQTTYNTGKRDYIAKLIEDIVRCSLEEQKLKKKGISDAHNIVMGQPAQKDLRDYLELMDADQSAPAKAPSKAEHPGIGADFMETQSM